jgi:hypothetical protein
VIQWWQQTLRFPFRIEKKKFSGRTNHLLFFNTIDYIEKDACNNSWFAAVTSIPNCYRATIGWYAYGSTEFPLMRHRPHRKRRVQRFIYCCLYSFCWTCLHSRCLATKVVMHFTEPLLRNERRNRHTDTQSGGRDLWSKPLRWGQVPRYAYQFS